MELRYWALIDAPDLYSIYRTSSGLERQMPALASEEDARNLIETSYLPAENRAIFCLSDEGRPAGLHRAELYGPQRYRSLGQGLGLLLAS